MKIIKKGRITEPWFGLWGCRHCGCEWEMEKGDPQPRRHDDRQGDFFSMDCPNCKKECFFYPQAKIR